MSSDEVKTSETDVIAPVEIKHQVDEILVAGRIDQYYNYLEYHFERLGLYCQARAYLDEIDTVSICGPFSDRSARELVESAELLDEVISYFKRRYVVIQMLRSEGCVTVWEHPARGAG
ncbi:MAG: hypothetical protein MI920_19715 [Kiloniellales bacterium]|nr:hypothetical protein [Kiloniellales bacterium]